MNFSHRLDFGTNVRIFIEVQHIGYIKNFLIFDKKRTR